jgi:hypothetical protein
MEKSPERQEGSPEPDVGPQPEVPYSDDESLSDVDADLDDLVGIHEEDMEEIAPLIDSGSITNGMMLLGVDAEMDGRNHSGLDTTPALFRSSFGLQEIRRIGFPVGRSQSRRWQQRQQRRRLRRREQRQQQRGLESWRRFPYCRGKDYFLRGPDGGVISDEEE